MGYAIFGLDIYMFKRDNSHIYMFPESDLVNSIKKKSNKNVKQFTDTV